MTELLLCNVINVAGLGTRRVRGYAKKTKGTRDTTRRKSGKYGPSGNNCPGLHLLKSHLQNIVNDVNQSRAQLSRVFARRGQINSRFDTQPFGER